MDQNLINGHYFSFYSDPLGCHPCWALQTPPDLKLKVFKTYFQLQITELYKSTFLDFSIVNNGMPTSPHNHYSSKLSSWLLPHSRWLVSAKFSLLPHPNLIPFCDSHWLLVSGGIIQQLDCGTPLTHLLTILSSINGIWMQLSLSSLTLLWQYLCVL